MSRKHLIDDVPTEASRMSVIPVAESHRTSRPAYIAFKELRGGDGMVDEFVRIAVISRAGEPEEAFSARLSEFWTHMLREFKDDFEKVYAETIEFESCGDRLERHYLCEDAVVELVVREMDAWGIEHPAVDWDDRWNKYEAIASEWMQIEH